jgi:hypothetical protein
MALRLSRFCGSGPGLWLRMQQSYDLWHAERRLRDQLDKIPMHRSAARSQTGFEAGRRSVAVTARRLAATRSCDLGLEKRRSRTSIWGLEARYSRISL